MLQPFADHLVEVLRLDAGQAVCELVAGVDQTASAFARAVGPTGSVIRVSVDAARRIPLGDGSVDAVVSIFSLGFGDPRQLLEESRRVAGDRGCIGVLVWDASQPPAHELALRDATRTAGLDPRTMLAPILVDVDGLGRLRREPIGDVLRFDGIDAWWASMVTARPAVATAVGALDAVRIDGIRRACELAMLPFTAADGTMRVPVQALLLS